MATHVVFRALLAGLVVVGCGRFCAAQPPAPNLLEEVRMRQKIADERAAAYVAASERQLAVVALISPEAAHHFSRKVRAVIANDPDLSSTCRSQLTDNLKRFLKN